jgi:hypothetical protein
MHQRIISFLIVILLLTGLVACGDRAVDRASQIIKENLRSPSSFSLISGKQMWSGKNSDGNEAYVVRVEYDSQNGFGSMIRDCKMVGYSVKGDKLSWQGNQAIADCGGGNSLFTESQMADMVRENNFGK